MLLAGVWTVVFYGAPRDELRSVSCFMKYFCSPRKHCTKVVRIYVGISIGAGSQVRQLTYHGILAIKRETIVAKARNTSFFCKECGYESAKWLGQCPVCKEWNTFVEEPVAQAKKAPSGQIAAVGAGKTAVPVHISEISLDEQDRTPTGFGELDRVLGSGIVKGSLVLVGGDPGIGKSTLLVREYFISLVRNP